MCAGACIAGVCVCVYGIVMVYLPVSSTTNLIMEYALGIDKDILGVAYSLGRASWAGMVLGKFV